MSLDTPVASSAEQRHLQSRWYWYDGAIGGYAVVTATVLFGPYLTSVANKASCPAQDSTETCRTNLEVLGVAIAPGSLFSYTITLATILSAVVLVFGGALLDRLRRPTLGLAILSTIGACTAMAMSTVAGDGWLRGSLLLIVTNVAIATGAAIYNAMMCRITPAHDRDRVSTTGWSYGYLAGAILMIGTLVLLSAHDSLGLSTTAAVRIALFVSGLWWLCLSTRTVIGLWHLPAASSREPGAETGLARLRSTFATIRSYPQTLKFLLAFLFYNDGIQTVIAVASVYGQLELKFSQTELVVTILIVQIVAFVGARLFGLLARRWGAYRVILYSLVAWGFIVAAAYFVPQHGLAWWLVLACLIGVVLGGSQALSRSLFSHLIPAGRETEFFSFYQAMDRGTSWLGTLVFGLVYQIFHSYRLSIFALLAFFAIGGMFLSRVRMREGIEAAGNPAPAII